jgi:hypothetical protein
MGSKWYTLLVKQSDTIICKANRTLSCVNRYAKYFIRNHIVICTFLSLYEGGKLTIPFYLYFPLLVRNETASNYLLKMT